MQVLSVITATVVAGVVIAAAVEQPAVIVNPKIAAHNNAPEVGAALPGEEIHPYTTRVGVKGPHGKTISVDRTFQNEWYKKGKVGRVLRAGNSVLANIAFGEFEWIIPSARRVLRGQSARPPNPSDIRRYESYYARHPEEIPPYGPRSPRRHPNDRSPTYRR